MRKIDSLLNEYGDSHRNRLNKLIHWICVPPIVWTVVALLWSIPFPWRIGSGIVPLNWAVIALLFGGVLMGAGCWAWQIYMGVGVAGMNTPVHWGTYLINFVFWVGIAHSGTLISAILHLFRAGWRNPIARAAETMTVFAVCTAGHGLGGGTLRAPGTGRGAKRAGRVAWCER